MKIKLLALPLICLSLLGCSTSFKELSNTEVLNEKYRDDGYEVIVTNPFHVPGVEYESNLYKANIEESKIQIQKAQVNDVIDERTNYDVKITCGDGTRDIKVYDLFVFRDSDQFKYQLANNTLVSYSETYTVTLHTLLRNDDYSLYMVLEKSVLVFHLDKSMKDLKTIKYYFNDNFLGEEYAFPGEKYPFHEYITDDGLSYVNSGWKTKNGKSPTLVQDNENLYVTSSDLLPCTSFIEENSCYSLQIDKLIDGKSVVVPKTNLNKYLKISIASDNFIILFLPLVNNNIVLDLDIQNDFRIYYEGSTQQFENKISIVQTNRCSGYTVVYNKTFSKDIL